jgi:hypothetical protein
MKCHKFRIYNMNRYSNTNSMSSPLVKGDFFQKFIYEILVILASECRCVKRNTTLDLPWTGNMLYTERVCSLHTNLMTVYSVCFGKTESYGMLITQSLQYNWGCHPPLFNRHKSKIIGHFNIPWLGEIYDLIGHMIKVEFSSVIFTIYTSLNPRFCNIRYWCHSKFLS